MDVRDALAMRNRGGAMSTLESIEMVSRWRTLGEVGPPRLVASRETLHHAAQLVALAGASFLDAEADDSHTSMAWLTTVGPRASQPIRPERTLTSGLLVS